MTQEERWMAKWQEVMDFMEVNKRRPSKYAPEERNSWNWLRHNQKLYNNGAMRPEREEKFRELLRLSEQYKRKNQYK
jgi:hypothetical protein